MIAIFKSVLVRKFDEAIKAAEDSKCEILCFKLDSYDENQLLADYVNIRSQFSIANDHEYEGIPIQLYAGAADR